MVQNNISQIGEGTENPDKELGGLQELPNVVEIVLSSRGKWTIALLPDLIEAIYFSGTLDSIYKLSRFKSIIKLDLPGYPS